MKINVEEFEIEFINDSLYSPTSTDNVRKYDKEYILVNDHIYSPHIGIVVKEKNGSSNSCIVFSSGVESTIGDNSIIVKNNFLYLSIGNLVSCFDIPKY